MSEGSMLKFISKEELFKRVTVLLKEFELIGPKDLPNKGVFYENITDTKELYLGEIFAVEPIKKFFLNPSECFANEALKADAVILEEMPVSENKRLIIGATPCEARGLVLLDKVFDSDYKDKMYINNRKRTVIVGLACIKPDNSCFCTSMGGSPVETSGMDVMLFATEGGFIVDIITEKGKDIFGSLGEDAGEGRIKAWELDKDKKNNSLKTKIKPPEPKSLDAVFSSDYWYEVSQSCLSCGICTYLCPSCHCFDLVDEGRKKLRCYDGCAFADFTLEASGENPRPTKKERYRQRVFHKFNYFKKNFGENLCVGCGRCIRFCPVKINIAEIIDKAPVASLPTPGVGKA